MSLSKGRWSLLLVLATVSAPAAAQAPGKPPSQDAAADGGAMSEKARELFREGNKHYRAEKWAQAEAAFEAAWALTDKKSLRLVNNLGQTEMHLGKYREAAEHLVVARRLAGKDDKQLPDIERDFAEAKTKVGTLVVTANVDGAQLLLNDKPIGQAPLVDPLFIDPGKVTLTAFKEGYETAKMDVSVAAGQEVPVPFTLKKLEAPPPAPTVTATATAPPPPPRSMVPAFVIGGAALAGVAVGAGLLVASRGQYDAAGRLHKEIADASGTCKPGAAAVDGRCSDLESTANASNALKGGGIAALAIGGVAAAGALAWWLWPAPKPAQGSLRLVPVAAEGTAGVIMMGRF